VLKTERRPQRIDRDLTRPLMLAVVAFMIMVSAWRPFLDSRLMDRWFIWPNLLYLSPLPILTDVAATWLWRALLASRELAPFVLALSLFAPGFRGLVAGRHAAKHRAAHHEHPGRRLAAVQPGFRAGRRDHHDPGGAVPHRVFLLRVSRQGACWGVPLTGSCAIRPSPRTHCG
jgi:hypothetical protein